MSIRVLLAEDHPLVRDGIRAVLAQASDLTLVAEATTGTDAVLLAVEHRPDLILMDLCLPELSGIEATRKIMARLPHTRILMLSMHSDGELVHEALRSGAKGYLHKICDGEELLRGIHRVIEGHAFLSPAIAEGLATRLGSSTPDASDDLGSLTPRQREVLRMLAEGMPTKDIATRLGRSVKTVDMHRQHILAKLNLKSTTQLVRLAIRKGIAPLEV
jgi:DNA-binding NarL/FixJ family response regulator